MHVGGADGSLLVHAPEHEEDQGGAGERQEEDRGAAEDAAGVVDVDGGAEETREPDVTGMAAAHAGAGEAEETLGEALTMGAVNAGGPTVRADTAALVPGGGPGRFGVRDGLRGFGGHRSVTGQN